MIADIVDILATARSGRIVRATLSARRISAIFAEIRGDLSARTLHAEVRKRDRATRVLWSLWVGRFQKPVPWLVEERLNETRYGFLLLLERDGFVGVLGSNIGNIAEFVSEDRVSYQKLLALHSDADTEIEALSTRSLRAARVGVTQSTQRGRHLEKTLSRVGANQAAPFQVSLRHADQAWRISPGSGRVALSGGRATIPEICAWFGTTCQDIEQATEPSDFIKAFAQPFVNTKIDTEVLTVAEFIDQHYVPRYYQAESIKEIKSPDGRSKVKLLRRDLGELRLKQLESEVVVDDYKKQLQAKGLGAAGYNRRLSKLRQMLNWAKDWKFISAVPFSRNLVSLDTDLEIGRERRLEPGEEEKLLRASDAEMKLRIIAAVDTGMRKGEMLRVQLKRVDFKHGFIQLPRRVLVKDVYRQNTKNDRTRRIPITPRLMKLLKKRRFIGAEGYVFGDATGALVEDIKKPWNTVNLLAHGCNLEWTVGGNLSEKCWEDLRTINLHWHDLRHEALSRLGESGELSDHELMEIAGHANLTTTQRYLNTRIERLKQGVLRAAAKRPA